MSLCHSDGSRLALFAFNPSNQTRTIRQTMGANSAYVCGWLMRVAKIDRTRMMGPTTKSDMPIPHFPKGSSNCHPSHATPASGRAVAQGAISNVIADHKVPPTSRVPSQTAIGRLIPHTIAPTTATPNPPTYIAANENATSETINCVICQKKRGKFLLRLEKSERRRNRKRKASTILSATNILYAGYHSGLNKRANNGCANAA